MLQEKIKKKSSQLFESLREWRRHIHMHPELSKQEHETAAFVAKVLADHDIAFTPGVAGTGLVGMIRGREPEKACIALRADLDALPIYEINEVSYRSKKEGIMHACGHDAHTASLLGTAVILQSLRDEFTGTVKLFFQPSEEQYPGGAIQMIEEGVLEDPSPAMIFGQHVLPSLDAGKAGFREGKYMASTDELHITVIGKGGHGATPELVTDPVTIAAQLITALQQLVSRKAKPGTPTVLSFGRVIANGQTNIIPDQVEMHGILRTFDEAWRARAKEEIRRITEGICKAMGAECELIIDEGYPYVVNNEKTTELARSAAKEYLGEKAIEYLEPRMTAEDFAYFSHQRPSCFYRLGIRNESRGITSNLHTSSFDIDENALETGAGLMAWIAVNALKELSAENATHS